MSSKNLLLLGSLLFLLLVTLCSVAFIERYNPLMQTVSDEDLVSEEIASKQDTPASADLFTEEIPIATTPQPPHTPLITEENISQIPQPTTSKLETNVSVEDNLSSAPLHVIAPKIDLDKLSLTTTTHAMESNKTVRTIHKSEPKVRKYRKRKQKRVITAPILQKDKIEIEPVILNRRLHVSTTGKLHRWDKTFLNDLAHRFKQNRRLLLELYTTTPVSAPTRIYMQNIRKYLIKHGVEAENIKLIVRKERKKRGIVITDDNHNKQKSIELALIERM
jgi:hypothetical protein